MCNETTLQLESNLMEADGLTFTAGTGFAIEELVPRSETSDVPAFQATLDKLKQGN